MENPSLAGPALLLALIMIVLASIAVSQTAKKLKVSLQILAGTAVGIIAAIAIGAAFGNGVPAGDLSVLLPWCGGIWVSVREIRHARSARNLS
jgi:hypothetical protein